MTLNHNYGCFSGVGSGIAGNSQIYEQHINTMGRISAYYTTTHAIKGNEIYQFCGRKCFNVKKNIQLKMQYKNGSLGYYINREFKTLNELRKQLVKL